MIAAKPLIEALKPYVAPLEGRRSCLRLDFNENTLGPSPVVRAAMQNIPDAEWAAYPEYDGLREAIAERVGIDAAQVGLFNGADAAIRAIFDAFGSTDEVYLSAEPTFGYYAPCAALQGMRRIGIPYATDLSYPIEAIDTALKTHQPRLFFVCNPNNPTGTLLAPEQILAWAAAHPRTLVVVDEIYVDFTGVSVLPQALAHDNIIVLRSFSKAYGLAALRLGYAMGHPELLERLRRVTGPYDINAWAVRAALAALQDVAYVERYAAEVATAKAWTVAELKRLGQRTYVGAANYILVWPDGLSSTETCKRLREAGILVRDMVGKAVIDGSFRVTIGTQAQMAQFIQTFRANCGN